MKNPILLYRPLFKSINEAPFGYFQGDVFPLSIAYITALLEQEGFNVIVADPSEPKLYMPKEIIRTIVKEKPVIVGLSCFVQNRFACLEIAKIVKKINPNIKVVFGGTFPTFLYKQILAEWPVDIVVLYEGEYTFLELCRRITKKLDLYQVNNIAFKDGARIIKTPPGPFIKNLDCLPYPAYHRFRIAKRAIYGLSNPVMRLEYSRGCPFSCTFCSSVGMWQRMVRYFSINRIIEEITFLKKKFDLHFFGFSDINFATDIKRAVEFCKQLKKNKIDINWSCCTRADNNLSLELLTLMKNNGCMLIECGIESLSDKILKSIQKGTTVKMQIEKLNQIYDLGINISINLIIGFPAETKETIYETLCNLKNRLPPLINFELGILKLYPGSIIYNNEVVAGRFNEDIWLNPGRLTHLYIPKGMSFNELESYRYLLASNVKLINKI
jgi:radical SAM superfamily enzyme YgiQ (UPF0313 family)